MTYPQAFLSYTRIDDEYFGGNITSLRKLLELGVRVVAGDQSFQIFQDVDGIELGQQWEKRIGNAITSARFLIPIITPCFFSSHPCRDEFTKFVEHEKTLARDDLILPIYFVTVPSLEKIELRNSDPLAVEVSKRQRFDWREWSELPISDPTVRKAVRELSQQIVLACQRTSQVVIERAQAAIADQVRDNQVDQKLQSASLDVDVPSQTSAPLRSRKTKSILWVDDRPDNNFYEREALKRYGIEFELATSTETALHILSSSKFDVIISDMGRPPDPRAGYTLLKAVREKGDTTPYLIYAGSRAREHRDEAARQGAQGTTNIADELINMVLTAVGGASTKS
jgi:CheY-like chemotaxis protein